MLRTCARLAALAFATALAFFFSGWGRCYRYSPDFSFDLVLRGFLGVAFTSVLLFSLLPILLLIDRWATVDLPTIRARRAQCIRCEYPLAPDTHPPGHPCPECGSDQRIPPLRQWPTLVLYLAIAIPSMLLASLTADLYIRLDDRRFAVTLQQSPTTTCLRPRPWPFTGYTLVRVPGYDVRVND